MNEKGGEIKLFNLLCNDWQKCKQYVIWLMQQVKNLLCKVKKLIATSALCMEINHCLVKTIELFAWLCHRDETFRCLPSGEFWNSTMIPSSIELLSIKHIIYVSCQIRHELTVNGRIFLWCSFTSLRYHIIDRPGVLGNNVLGSYNCSYDLIRCIEQLYGNFGICRIYSRVRKLSQLKHEY